MVNRLFFTIALTFLLASSAFCQFAASPVGSVGIGRFNSMALIQNRSMGGVGIGTGSYWNLNNLNPAMLMYNRGTIFNGLTSFQSGLVSERITISDPEKSELSNGAGMTYLATGFPLIMNRWYTSMGLMPYVTSNYILNYTKPVIGRPDLTNYVHEKGSGGYNTIYMSHGVKVTKNISLGLTGKLLFGSREKEFNSHIDISSMIDNPENQTIGTYDATLYQRSNVKGIIFTGGIAYQDSIKMAKNDPLKVTFGLIYDFKKGVNAREFETLERRSVAGVTISNDTLVNNPDGQIVFPSGIGAGFSLSRGFKWNAGLDVGMKNYDELLVFGETLNTTNTFYINSGVEYTPNAFSVDGYLKRVTYRMGSSFQKTPYLINGMEVNDFGINFGASFPIVPSSGANSIVNKGFSSVDLGFEYGVQGNLADNLLRENYFRFNFGVTFNDKWFVRRKFN